LALAYYFPLGFLIYKAVSTIDLRKNIIFKKVIRLVGNFVEDDMTNN
jgi:hypothetical protein